MKYHKILFTIRLAVAVLAAVFFIQNVKAQQIYSQNFNTDDSANWAVNASYTNTTFNPKTLVDFNFDYTTAGLPIAPHSVQFGSAAIHRGLKMSACYTNPATLLGSAVTTGLSAAPTNFSITANFVMHADMWMNVNCTAYPALNTNNFNTYTTNNSVITTNAPSFADNNHDSTASTVFYGCGYGTQGIVATTPGVTDAIWVGALTDNGTSAQYRMYGPKIQSSYQDGSYQSSGTLTPGFVGDPFAYNLYNASISSANGGPAGVREVIGTTGNPPFASNLLATNMATGKQWATIFPPSVVPLAQQILYPQQTNNCSCPGLVTFAWHDVSVEKVGNVIVYKIDGNIIATGNYSSAGTPPGGFLTFVATRTGSSVASASTGALYTNLNFVVFANIVVSNYDNIVNVSATTPTTTEGVPGSPGVFTVTRSSAGVPLTVNYTVAGTAANGVQYQTLPGSVTFSSTDTSTNINVVPIDDGIPNLTTTVVLTLQSGAGYAGAGSAVVSILDSDPATVDISGSSQAYGRYTNTVVGGGNNDFINYTLTRRGQLTTGADLAVNLSYGGTAVSGTDFAPAGNVTIPDGIATVNFTVSPVYNPSVTTNRTVVVTVASGTGYNVGSGSATGMVVSANYAPNQVLISDDLTSSADAVNWNITYGCGDLTNDAADYEVNFGMSLASAAGGISIPPPPGGNANALHLTCNKDVSPGSAGTVNVYYTNVLLSGNYAVRFNMNLIQGQTAAVSTEGAVFGINHSGIYSNWWYASGPIATNTFTSDGQWYYVTAQGAGTAAGDYQEFTGLGGTNGNAGWQRLATQSQTSYANVFKESPGPFSSLDASGSQTPGIPANGTPALGYDASTWSDVEIKQQNNIVTMSINHTAIFTYTNTTVWTNGYLMLGYSDPYGGSTSIGSPEAGAYYANLQVVQLPATVVPTVVTITGITASGGNVIINFTTSNTADTIGSFTVVGSSVVTGPYATTASSIAPLGGQLFQATIPQSGSQQFYRIFHP